jgi:tetratricopeptide (TPR) repeat protein
MAESNDHIAGSDVTRTPANRPSDREPEFAEPIPEYLRPGYRALMVSNGFAAIELWEALYAKYPSAEVCSHLSRAHYYQIYFLGHDHDPKLQVEHVAQMRLWAERALGLNPNSSTGHAMLAGAIGLQAQLTGSQKQIISSSWMVRHHAERAVLIDNNSIGHLVLGRWHRELASVNAGLRMVVQLIRGKLPEGSYERSLHHFGEILKIYPDNNTIYAEMAYTYERMGEWKRAQEMFQRCISMPLFKHPLATYQTRRATEWFTKRNR